MGIGKLLADKIAAQGLSKNQVAEAAKVPASTLYSIIKRDNTKVEIDAFLRICDVLKCSPEEFSSEIPTVFFEKNVQLTQQEESMIKKYRALDPRGKDVIDTVLEKEYSYRTKKEKQEKALPRFSIRLAEVGASAGIGNWIDDCRFEEIEIKETPEAHLADFAVKVDGDSMQPDYDDGDIVLVISQPSIYQGQIGIFCVDGSTYIKELGENELISENPKFDNIPIYEYTDIRCIGRVICKAVVL